MTEADRFYEEKIRPLIDEISADLDDDEELFGIPFEVDDDVPEGEPVADVEERTVRIHPIDNARLLAYLVTDRRPRRRVRPVRPPV